MNINNYFPLGIAKGKAFFNRNKERTHLANNIKAGNDCFVISTRRYGKTSLILNVLEDIDIPYKEIDLFTAKESDEIEKIIVSGIFDLMNAIIPKHEQLFALIKEYFKKVNVKTRLGSEGVSFELEKNSLSGANILEALNGLDKILIKKSINAVIFIDEFQQIGKLKNSTSLEGAIRHIAQKSDNIVFIFSGSNRHILNRMITDKSKPLYKLCNKLTINRMQKKHYITHLLEASTELWGQPFSIKTIDKIIEFSELHPFYINALCNNLYISMSDTIPTESDIEETWKHYIIQEKSNTAKELDALNHSQYAVLKYIACGNNNTLTGKQALSDLNLAMSTVRTALINLETMDYILKNNQAEYVIIDPLIKSSIISYTN